MTLISIGLAAWSISSVVTALAVIEAKTSTIELVSQTWELQPLVNITFVAGANAQCPATHPEVLSRWSFPVSTACVWCDGLLDCVCARQLEATAMPFLGHLPLASPRACVPVFIFVALLAAGSEGWHVHLPVWGVRAYRRRPGESVFVSRTVL